MRNFLAGVAFGAAASGLLWVTIARAHMLHELTEEVQFEVEQRVNLQMQEACSCWFTGNGCPREIVVCRRPDFLKERP